MKIPRKQLRTILKSIRCDETATQPNSYIAELTINGVDYTEVFELEDDGSVIGSVEALEPRWWAVDIVLGHVVAFARGEAPNLPADLGDLGDPALAGGGPDVRR